MRVSKARRARARFALVVVAGGLGGAVGLADEATAGVVTGKLELPAAPERPAPATKGYLARSENPYLPPQEVDPTPYMVVVLTGGTSEAKAPAEVVWELRGDSFAQPLLPVRAGSKVVVRNASKRPVTLSTVEDPSVLKNAVINPPASKEIKAPAAGAVLTVVDTERAHVRGSVVGFDAPYFVVPSASGAFEFPDVAPGKWTVRVWYRTGWLERADDTITVGSAKVEVKPKVPSGFPIAGAKAAAGAAAK
jgi:hypothetical protein